MIGDVIVFQNHQQKKTSLIDEKLPTRKYFENLPGWNTEMVN